MTEMITGVDLIQEQLRAAQGHVLRFNQEDIKIEASASPALWLACPDDVQGSWLLLGA